MLVRVSSWDVLKVENGQEFPVPDISTIQASARRRLNLFGRNAGALAANKIDTSPLIVFASRYGDVERSVAILEQISSGEDISPMNFSLSVHNAVSGLLSIAWKMTEMQSVVAAGSDTFIMGFTEALSLLNAFPKQDVLLVYIDFPLPAVFSEFEEIAGGSEVFTALLSADMNMDEGVVINCEKTETTDSRSARPMQAIESLLSGTIEKVIVETDSFGWGVSKYVA
mgnify:CR=1 FL=1